METTIIIEDEVLTELNAEVERRRGATFETVVNETLRLGLQAKQNPSVQATPSEPQSEQADRHFKVHARAMGKMPDLNYDKISSLIEQIEGANHR